MKGYKGFNEGLTCRDKQYAENTVFEEDSAKICEAGMHFCENPLDVLDYYGLATSEYAEVEALDEVFTNDGKKHCTKKLKIGRKLSLREFIKASVDFLMQKNEAGVENEDDAQLASSGDHAQLAASGDRAQLASSGYASRLVASGDNAQLAVSGNYSQLAASGDGSRLTASGYRARLAASGDEAKLAASGYGSKLAATGDNCVIANIGHRGKVKGKKGTWIILAEYDPYWRCVCVKSAQIDGEVLKEDVWYTLDDGEFKEAKE